MKHTRCILDHDISIPIKEKKQDLLLIVDSLCPLGNEITYLLRQKNIDHLDIRGKEHLDINSSIGEKILNEFVISKSLVVCNSSMSHAYSIKHPVISAVKDIRGNQNFNLPPIFGHIRGKHSLEDTEDLYYKCLTKNIEKKEKQSDQNKTKYVLAIDAAKYILNTLNILKDEQQNLSNLKTYSFHSLYQKFYSHCILDKKDDLIESLLESCKPYPPQDNKTLTLSIVMLLSLDKKYSSSASKTFYFFEHYLKNFPPFLPFEFVVVVIENNDNTDIDSVLQIGNNTRRYIRYIKISRQFYESFMSKMNFVNFPEFILKNVGIRRSKGEFILSISIDSFPNKVIFDYILNRQFNMNSYVRALRKNTGDNLIKISKKMDNEQYSYYQGFSHGNKLKHFRDSMFTAAQIRIFVITGSILVVIALLLMMYCYEIGTFLKPSHPQPYRKIVFIVAHVIASTAGNIVQSPARVLCSDVTPLTQQSLMANICQVYFGVSSIFSNLLGGFEVYKYTGLKQEQFLLVVCLSLALVAMIISIISAVEEPLLVKPPKANPFKKIWQAFKTMPRPFIRIVAPYCLSFVAIYQFGLAFTDFMGAEIMHGNNAESASSELKELYQKGVSWAMMCNSVNSFAILTYSFLNNKVCETIGMRWTMVIGDFLVSVSLLFFLFSKNKYVYLGVAGFLGLGSVTFMAIPTAIVSIVIPSEELGNNLGILNCFCVIGQQLSNFIIGSGVGKIVHNSSGKKIGYSAVFGFLATIASFWVVQPSIAEAGQYQSIKDNPTDFTYVSEINN